MNYFNIFKTQFSKFSKSLFLKISIYDLIRNQLDPSQLADYQKNRFPVECKVLMSALVRINILHS